MQTSDVILEKMFESLRRRFDVGNQIFKGTQSFSQFMKQGEIDVLGLDQNGDVHAIDVAFHEAGLLYNSSVATILKKMLRTHLLLNRYMRPQQKFHIYFLSPKVNRKDIQPLENIFAALRDDESTSTTDWHLVINEDFSRIANQTLEKAAKVSDTSELFIRSSRLLDLTRTAKAPTSGFEQPTAASNPSVQPGVRKYDRPVHNQLVNSDAKLQPIVRRLMHTLLDDHPTLLDAMDIQNLMDRDYCKTRLGINIANLPLLRSTVSGRFVGGRSRFWSDVYGGRFFVCSQWWKEYHARNAASLLRWVREIVAARPDHPGKDALASHARELERYLGLGISEARLPNAQDYSDLF